MDSTSTQALSRPHPSYPSRLIWLVLGLFVLLSGASSVINPLHEATDELRHYRFVRNIVQNGSLPIQGEMGCSMQGHHPPLFYTAAALVTFWVDTGQAVCHEPELNPFWNYRQWEVSDDNKNLYLPRPAVTTFPWSGEALAAHLTRLVNVLFGAGTIFLTWLTGKTLWPKRPYLALGSAALLAFNPMFVYMAGAVNNDVIAAFSGTAVVLVCIQLVLDPDGLSRRWAIILGLVYSVALMSKFNLLAVGGVIGVAATWTAWRRKQWRIWGESIGIAGVIVLLLTGWWFVRNQILYGEPTGFQRLTELWGVRDPSESWGVAIFELKPTWTSLWGRFGYGQIPIPEPIYITLLWIVGIGLLGLLIPLLRGDDEFKRIRLPLLLLGLNVLLFFVVVFNYLLVSPAGAMGRFFFPGLSSLVILTFYGLSSWVGLLPFGPPTRRQAWLTGVSYAGMIGLTAVALFGYLAPAYADMARFDAETAVPNEINARFDSLFTLRGYSLTETAVTAGGPIDIDLYWEVDSQPPGNYLLFVHVVDSETGAMIVQRDTHTGLGNAPTRDWRPGERRIESIRVWLPETVYTPGTAVVSVGLYVPGAYRLGITAADGTGLGDALTLGTVPLTPATTPQLAEQFPNPQNQNFNNELRLVGYEYDRRMVTPGGSVTVTFYWQSLQNRPTDYLVRLTLLDQAGQPLLVQEQRPQNGRLPTSQWADNQLITDSHQLTIPDTPDSQIIDIHVALIDSVSQTPQNIVAEDGRWINNFLSLSPIQVQP